MQVFIPQTDARGCIMPNFIFYHKELSNGAKMLYTALCSYARAKSFCYPTKSTLATKLNCSRNTLISWLNQLLSFNFIKIKQTEKGETFFLFSPEESAKNFNSKPSKTDDNMSKIDNEVNENNLNNKINPLSPPKRQENQTEPDKPLVGGIQEINQDFEKLWEIYPRKEAKESARNVWISLYRKNKIQSFEEIKYAVQSFYQSHSWQREQGRFIPHLVNFLKGLRWKDIDFPKQENKQKVNTSIFEAPVYTLARKIEDKANNNDSLNEEFLKYKFYFQPMNKIDECYATVLFDKLYSERKVPKITEKQPITFLNFLKQINQGV